MKRKRFLIFASLTLLLAMAIIACWQGVVLRKYTVETDKISNPIRVIQLSDLHSSFYGRQQQHLIRKIDRVQPDMIVLTGDIADDSVEHDGTQVLLSQIAAKYPCFYVCGNHETWCGNPEEVYEMIASYGVTVLRGDGVTVSVGESSLVIYGVDDPDSFGGYHDGAVDAWQAQLASCEEQTDADMFNLLLSHRPELVDEYADSAFDLVLSGHAHGGQVRLPFINGLWAPNQGWFPQYAGGQYALNDDTTLIVSRGLAKSRIPRVFNPPELVVIDLVSNA